MKYTQNKPLRIEKKQDYGSLYGNVARILNYDELRLHQPNFYYWNVTNSVTTHKRFEE